MAHPFAPQKPAETAPMIALAWGAELAPVVSTMMVNRERIAQRLVLAPRRVLNSVAAYIHHALAAEQDITQIAQDIEEKDVRALLSCAIKDLHPRLFRMLDRLGPTALNMTVYRRLNEVLHGPAADLLLLDADEDIKNSHLDVVTAIVADPVLLAARKAVGRSGSDLQNLQLALSYLRAKGLAADIEKLPPGCGWRSILRRITTDLGRARAPQASFNAPAGWRQIEDVAGLWRVGTALGNCVSSFRSGDGYIEPLITGEAVYLVHDDDPLMLAKVHRVGPNLWTLAETTTSRPGSDIMKLRQGLHVGLSRNIAATGGALLETSPLSAIRSIAWRVERHADDGLGDFDDLDDLDEVA